MLSFFIRSSAGDGPGEAQTIKQKIKSSTFSQIRNTFKIATVLNRYGTTKDHGMLRASIKIDTRLGIYYIVIKQVKQYLINLLLKS